MANYLYNGVELPDIDEVWTDDLKKQYPYAIIVDRTSAFYNTPRYSLELYSSMTTVVESGEFGDEKYVKTTGAYATSRCYINEQPLCWNEPYFGSYSNTVKLSLANPADHWVWSNTDILNADGSVFFAASEPIPVKPIDPIDPNSLLQGYLVGCRLRAMRGKPVVPSDGQYEVIFANSELYIKKAPAVMLGTVLSLSGADN